MWSLSLFKWGYIIALISLMKLADVNTSAKLNIQYIFQTPKLKNQL